MVSRCRGWFLTAWEVDLLTENRWLNEKFDEVNCDFLVYQIEKCEKTDKLHAQGVVWFKNPRYMNGVKAYFGSESVHLEPCRSQSQAVGYCMKEETRVAGPFTFGTVPAVVGRGHRTDLDDACVLAEEGRVEEIDASVLMRYGRGVEKAQMRGNKARYAKGLREHVEVYVYWGPPGVGKSEFAAQMWPDAYWKNADTQWWCGYEEEEVVIIDEFDCQFKYREFLRIMDNKPLQLQIKGGHMWAAWNTIVITCNSNPKSWYTGEDKAPMWRRLTRCTEVRGNTKCVCTVPSLEDNVWVHKPETEDYVGQYGTKMTRIAVYNWPNMEGGVGESPLEIVDYGDSDEIEDELEEL